MTILHISVAVANIKGNPKMTTEQATDDITYLFALHADITTAVEIDHPDY